MPNRLAPNAAGAQGRSALMRQQRDDALRSVRPAGHVFSSAAAKDTAKRAHQMLTEV